MIWDTPRKRGVAPTTPQRICDIMLDFLYSVIFLLQLHNFYNMLLLCFIQHQAIYSIFTIFVPLVIIIVICSMSTSSSQLLSCMTCIILYLCHIVPKTPFLGTLLHIQFCHLFSFYASFTCLFLFFINFWVTFVGISVELEICTLLGSSQNSICCRENCHCWLIFNLI